MHKTIALEKKNRLRGNISLKEINLLRPEVIIAFNLLRNCHIFFRELVLLIASSSGKRPHTK